MAGLSTIRVVDQPLRLPERDNKPLKASRGPSHSLWGKLPSASVVYGIGAIALCSRAGLLSPPPGSGAIRSEGTRAASSRRADWACGVCQAAGRFFFRFRPGNPAEMRSPRRIGIRSEALQLVSIAATLATGSPFVGGSCSTCRRSLQTCRQVLSLSVRIYPSFLYRDKARLRSVDAQYEMG
jgi:hypothetical protein